MQFLERNQSVNSLPPRCNERDNIYATIKFPLSKHTRLRTVHAYNNYD